jgi:hypothetical protein
VKQWYFVFRFFLACGLVFASGYFVAKPRNEADKVFAPIVCGIAVYSLWRSHSFGTPII